MAHVPGIGSSPSPEPHIILQSPKCVGYGWLLWWYTRANRDFQQIGLVAAVLRPPSQSNGANIGKIPQTHSEEEKIDTQILNQTDHPQTVESHFQTVRGPKCNPIPPARYSGIVFQSLKDIARHLCFPTQHTPIKYPKTTFQNTGPMARHFPNGNSSVVHAGEAHIGKQQAILH